MSDYPGYAIGGDLLAQARAMSSDTLFALTGAPTYYAIYLTWSAFLIFCEENNTRYSTLASAWRAFWAVYVESEEYKKL
jgi:hypothetical protein